MAIAIDARGAYRIMEEVETGKGEASPVDAVLFVAMSLVLGIASRHLLRGTRVPYTVALLVIGIALGSIEYGTHHNLGKFGHGIRIWNDIDPELLLAVFLPALLFESAFSMEVHQIKRCIGQMVLLAGPGVLISTFCLATLVKLTFPYDWDWKTSLLLGGLLSATDPVAVVALLKELGASKKISTVIEGESLMNDGTAIVVFQLFLKMVLGHSFGWGSIIIFLVRVALGAVGIGLAFGIVSVLWLRFIFNDTVIEITLTIAVSYFAYYTAQEWAEASGVLTVMTLGMFYAALARTAFKGDSQKSLHHFWEMVAYIANTLIFILSGVVIAEGILDSDKIAYQGNSWAFLFLLYLYIQLSRCVVVGVLYPFLCRVGYGLDWREAIILVWSGLRGAVALSLSLSVKQSSGNSFLSTETGTLFIFFTGGIVFLTLIVNGSTTQFVLRFLRMDGLPATKKRILEYTKFEMLSKALQAFEDLGDDEELGPADWPTVETYIASLKDSEGEQVHPHSGSETGNLDHTSLKDIRIRFLNGVQAAYWEMLDEGRISESTANILMRSVDEALDLVSTESLCDWKGLKPHVKFPSYYNFLHSKVIPGKLVTYFAVDRLESACYISAAFLRAHTIARQQLFDFLGESSIGSTVIKESEVEGEAAKEFLEKVRSSLPQVLRVVKTKQVTYSVLNHLLEYIQNLEKIGLLEEKEIAHLHDAVQTGLKKLLRNPPIVTFPKLSDLIKSHPLSGALPPAICEPLKHSKKETMKLRGVTLYKEGSKPTGIWLICDGIVKWKSKSLINNRSLHPTFSHGSTLGLYEVLTGKPYMCDMVTDSVVLCFFINSDKILSILQSDSTIEDFFWKESALVLVKLLRPQMFEKVAMQELRALVSAESSTLTMFVSGESIEIGQNSVGLLLEGFIKPVGIQEELVASPAALLPFNENQSFRNPSEASGIMRVSFSRQATRYSVETRARVIIFNIGAFGAHRALQRKPSSLSSPRGTSSDHQLQRSFSKEHKGLMRWPESIYEANQEEDQESNTKALNLSERAMQLSIFGSMVNLYRRSVSFGGMNNNMPQDNLSYKKLPSDATQGMVSARSEGSMATTKQIQTRKFVSQLPPQVSIAESSRSRKTDVESSDEEDEDEGIIVRIDSPSTIVFRNDV
uniref:Salt overly sensitive 1 n=1 Tax=Cochlearia hollandica TaxID=1166064 RepID=H9NDQ8_9BRAS|nr:salt overly sensitive 1 [Cochlearia hollandica]